MVLLVPVLRRLFTGRAVAHVSSPEVDESISAIQQAMLAALGSGADGSHATLRRRIVHANDLKMLWHLRADLMGALSGLKGESAARTILLEISEDFEGLLPGGLSTRPSPLGNH